MSKTEKRVALVANAYLLERDALRVELDAMRQRAEAAEKDADAMRCLAYERTQRKDIAEAALAAERARAEAAEHEAAALRASTEAAAVVYLRSEVDQLRAALAAAVARAEVAEERAAELEAHLAAYQRRAELDAAGIGAVCETCGNELNMHGWCVMCTPDEAQP